MKIETKSLEASLGGIPILKGIDLALANQEFVGVLGPNGSGKSTLLKCIYRVLKPTEGAVFLDGRELRQYKPKESAKKVAVVAQHHNTSFDFSVEEVVMMGRSPHKKAMERNNQEDYRIAKEALRTVQMEGCEKRSFSTLSGGEQQRVMVARALAQQTDCLILDEPTNHLDIKYQLQLMELIKKLELTVISAIHDLNIAAMYCDRLYLLDQGQIVAQGTPEQVLTEGRIRQVYEVDSRVFREETTGRLHILYHSTTARQETTN